MYTEVELKKIYQGNPWNRALHILRYSPLWFFRRVWLECRFRWLPPAYKQTRMVRGVVMAFDYAKDRILNQRMYLGLYELGVADIMRKSLREGDVFLDAGANVGYHTALGAGFVGTTGSVHAFEPIPEYAAKLQVLAQANKRHSIFVNQCALGERSGRITMYQLRTHRGERSFGTGSVFKDWLSNETVEAVLEVSVMKLDDYVKEHGLVNIKLLKIDVDGFEFPVLKGAQQVLYSQSPVIISEISHLVYERMGCTVDALLDYMAFLSYFPFDMANQKHRLSKEEINKNFINEVVFRKA